MLINKNEPISFRFKSMPHLNKRQFIECNIYQARKALNERGVLVGARVKHGYGFYYGTYHDELTSFNNARSNVSLQRIRGDEMRYGYYMSVLSNAELAQIKADEDKVLKEEQAELARIKRIQDVALGIVDFKTDVIYTNGKKESGKFYLNGIEYRLSSMHKCPTYWDKTLQRDKVPDQHILNLFNKAYENGEFESINYRFMTQAGYEIYLSGACS